MSRPLFLVFLLLSSCTGLFSGADRDTNADARTGNTSDASPPETDGASDGVGWADSPDARTPDASLDNAADSRVGDAASDTSLLDGVGHDALADARAVDTADGSSLLDGADLDATASTDTIIADAELDMGGPTCPAEACEIDTLRCDGQSGLVCEMRNGCGTWVQRVTCQGADMCCPSGGQLACVPPDANHCFSCTTACSGMTPACNTDRKACACNSGSCPTSFGCDDATGTCTACTAPAADATDFYTDIRAGVGGTGSANCPLRTITEALALAGNSKAIAKTVHVAAGIYSVESFPLVIREGITLQGVGAEKVTIAGLGKYTSPLPHEQAFLVTALLGDTAHENTIRGVTLTAGTAPKVAHYGVICDDGNLATPNGSAPPKNAPNSFLRDVTFGSEYDMAVGLFSVKSSQSGGNLRIDNVQFQDSWGAIWAATCDNSTPTHIYGNIEVSRSRFSGHTAAGVTVRGCVSINIEDSVFEDSLIGIQSWSELAFESEHSKLRIASSTFRRNSLIGAVFGGMPTELSNNTFIDNTTGTNVSSIALRLDTTATGGRSIYARGNRFIGNDIAIIFYGPNATHPNHLLDFGTPSDPGRNEFRCNSSVSSQLVRYYGFDVALDAAPTPGWVFHLAGNQWDHDWPSVQTTAGSLSDYNFVPEDGVDVLLADGHTATAIDTSGATRWVGACPADHIAGPDGKADAGLNP